MTTAEMYLSQGDIAWAAIEAIETLLDSYQVKLTADGEQALWEQLWDLEAIEVKEVR